MRQVTPKILLFALAVVLTGCGVPGAPLPPSLELPKPVTDLRALRKGDKVYLAWTAPAETTDRQSVRHLGPTQICRLDVAMTECGTPVGQAPASQLAANAAAPAEKRQAAYADSLPEALQSKNPTGSVTYAVSVLNENGRSAGLSNQVQVPAAPTLPPPSDFKAQATADGVALSWKEILHGQEAAGISHVYRVYRRPEGSASGAAMGEVALDASPAQFVDQSFEWEKTYSYWVTVATLISQPGKPDMQVEGDDTPTLKLFVHDVFPPAVPSGLQAVFSGPGQQPFIDLIWAPGTEGDLDGYNIYRHEEGGQPVKINSEMVKAPATRDVNVSSGKTYFYSVSAVDVRGNESARSEEASEQVP